MFGYLAFLTGVVVLLMVKDVERVTFPVFIMWYTLIGTDLWYLLQSKTKWIVHGLLILLLGHANYYAFDALPLDRITKYQQKEALAHEMKSLKPK